MPNRKSLKGVAGIDLEKGQMVSYPVQTRDGIVISVAVITQVGIDIVHLRRDKEDGSEYNFSTGRFDRLTVIDTRKMNAKT